MSLPNDLIDYILSFLQSDLDTLQKCAQSHSTLHKLSERYFYADIVLRDHFGREGILTIEFMQLLAKRPDIAKHVRCLTVRMSYGTSPTGYHIKGVASLLPTFSGLTNFIIKGSYLYDCPFKSKITWPHLHGMFQEAFLDFLHTQGKKKVTVCDAVGFPLSLLNNCENVRMTLHRCKDTQYDNESTEDVSLSCRKPFEHLSLVCCSETCLKSTTAWLQTRSLRSLEYQGWPQSNDKEIRQSLPRVLVACSHSLTNLCLHIEDHCTSSIKSKPIGSKLKSPIAIYQFKLHMESPTTLQYTIKTIFASFHSHSLAYATLNSLRSRQTPGSPATRQELPCHGLAFRPS